MIAAQHLKELREQKNYAQDYLAIELGISQKTYSNMENGRSRITLTQIKKLAKIYHTNPVNLVTKLFETSPKIIEEVEKEHPEASQYEVHHGVNSNLPLEMLEVYKRNLDDLRELLRMKEAKIKQLEEELRKVG